MFQGARKTKAEIEAGKKIGNLTIIWDTGKRAKNGSVILLTKDEEGNFKEVLSGNLFNKPEAYSGWSDNRRKTMIPNAVKAAEISKEKFSIDGTRANVLKDGKTEKTKSGYIGIHFEKQRNKWRVRFKFKGKEFSYFFDDFTESVIFRNKKAIELFNPVLVKAGILPIEKIERKTVVKNDYVMKIEKIISKKQVKKRNKNNVTNMFFDKKRNKFRVYTTDSKGKKKYLGSFKDEQQAIEVKQKYIKQLQEEINNDI